MRRIVPKKRNRKPGDDVSTLRYNIVNSPDAIEGEPPSVHKFRAPDGRLCILTRIYGAPPAGITSEAEQRIARNAVPDMHYRENEDLPDADGILESER